MTKMNWSRPRGSNVYQESLARIEKSGERKKKKGKWERGARFVVCGHYVADAWVLTKDDHEIIGRCPPCRRAWKRQRAIASG